MGLPDTPVLRPSIRVEFLGTIARRAETRSCLLCASTVGEALDTVRRRVPQLAQLLGTMLDGQEVCLLSVNGEAFTDDWERPLSDGDVLLILPADAGG